MTLTVPSLILQTAYSYLILVYFNLGIPSISISSQILGVVTLAVFFLATITFRTTFSILILGVSFFIVTMMPNLPNPDPIILLVALFMLMISFNYGRAAKTSFGRETNVSSRGPLHLKILSISLTVLLPFAAAILMIFISSALIGLAQQQVSSLPFPLADLSFLYFQTRVGFIMLATLITGIILWIVKEFLEPIILYFSLDRKTAKQYIQEEFSDVKKVIEKNFLRFQLGKTMKLKKPSVISILIGASILMIIIGYFGPTPENILENSESISNSIEGYNGEVFVRSISDAANDVDIYAHRLENLIRYLSSLIWGG